VRPELLAAYAFNPTFGLTGEVGFASQYSTSATIYDTYVLRYGAAADFNFAPALNLPLGAAVFFSDEIPLNVQETATSQLGVGLYEMINRSFNFGAEWARPMASGSSGFSGLLSLTAYY
jgi:hypothetical protein